MKHRILLALLMLTMLLPAATALGSGLRSP